jgi:hypothetical protein
VRTAIGNPDRDSCNEMCFCKVHICSPMRVTRMLSWRPAYQSCIAPRQGKPTLGRAEEQVLGNSQILDVLDTNNPGMAEAFPVTASSSGQVNSLFYFSTARTLPPRYRWDCIRATMAIRAHFYAKQ